MHSLTKSQREQIRSGGVLNPLRLIQQASLKLHPNQVLYEGEQHPVALSGDKRGYLYAYLGPFTQVEKRVKLNVKPINDLDAVAMRHDIDFNEASKALKSGKIDRPKFRGIIKEADERFIKGANDSKDDPIMSKIAKNIIKVKDIAESSGIINTKVFSGGKVKKEKIEDPLKRLKKLAKQK